MEAYRDDRKQVCKEHQLDEGFVKDEQNEVKRKISRYY
jgi:hypothetical protein